MSNSNQLLEKFLKTNKDQHFNFEEEIDYKVSSGSLLMDMHLGGGFGPGLHRFVGMNEGGKTSQALEVMRNFLESRSNAKGVFIKAEGRLGPEMRKRSGVKFVYSPDEWVDGTCFVFESNIYETVVDLMRQLVSDNEEKTTYCFVLDSVDGLIPKNDVNKSFEESAKVAGGAVIASHFMKRMSISLAKRGHMAIFISQVRADIKLDPYTKVPVRQTASTGGNALLHFANWILEFEPRFKSDLILKSPEGKIDVDKNPIIGHWAKVTVKKSVNEKTNLTLSYPVRYGKIGGKSIWREREILDMLLIWELIEKKGSWFTFSDDLKELIENANLPNFDSNLIKNKIQGEQTVFEIIENNEDLSKFLFAYLKNIENEV